MKITTALAFVAVLILPAGAWSQDAPIRTYLALWLFERLDNYYLANAIRAAFSRAPFKSEPMPSDGVITITSADAPIVTRKKITFAVEFLRDGTKIGEGFETCKADKLSDCTDQLVLDTESAAAGQ